MKRVRFEEVARGQEFRLPRKTEVKSGVKCTRGMGSNDPGLVRWQKTGAQGYTLVEWHPAAYSAVIENGMSLMGCTFSVSSPRVKVWVEA